MKSKKVRGQKRKKKNLWKAIDELAVQFDYSKEFEHFHVPEDGWLQEEKTNCHLKTEFCKKWLKKTEDIIAKKPKNDNFCKVVALLANPTLSASQIIIFYDESYYNTFFNRNDDYQTWTPIHNRSLVNSRKILTSLNEKGYIEILNEEDNIIKREIWFYGDV